MDYSSFGVVNEDDDLPTGYLQDVLFEFTSKTQRRKLTHHHHLHYSSFNNWWTSSSNDLIQNLNTTITSTTDQFITKCDHTNINYISGDREEKRKKKKKKKLVGKVVYPFDLVKPAGIGPEGDATLNDINHRILMPPTRPVRHPVGDFACRPLVSPDGPSLSGKAVVAFTKIHTQGRGTITIIRTRDH